MEMSVGMFAKRRELDIAVAKMRNEIIEACAIVASGGYPDNEPGQYALGRLAAAEAIRTMLTDESPSP